MSEAQLILSEEHRSAIEEHGQRSYPDECCGVLLGRIDGNRRIVEDLAPMANEWDEAEQRRRFLITPRELMRVEKEARGRGLDILGFYHSHPDAQPQPSEFDREHAWPWYIYPIVRIAGGKADGMRAWQLQDDRAAYQEIDVLPGEPANEHYSTVEQLNKSE